MKGCDEIKASDARVRDKKCCVFCHAQNVMYRVEREQARVCCHLAQVLLGSDYSFTKSVEIPDDAVRAS